MWCLSVSVTQAADILKGLKPEIATKKKVHTLYIRRNTGDCLKKIKFIGTVVLVGLLLPYTMTVFFMGNHVSVLRVEEEEERLQVKIGEKIREMTEEEYLLGALAAAMPLYYEEEALKAMVILLRTNFRILQQEQEQILVPADEFVEEHVRARAWSVGAYIEFQEQGKKLIAKTEGEVLKQDNTLIPCAYHKISAGETRGGSSQYSYLISVDSKQDQQSEQYLTITWIEKEEIKEMFPEVKEEQWAQIRFVTEGETSYVKEVHIGERIVSGEEFRDKLSLCSAAYFGSWWEKGLQIVCKGQGHGFGLSCYGANELAKEGKNYKEILSFYYKDASVSKDGIYSK